MSELKNIIEQAFERRADITPRNVETHISDAVNQAVILLDSGKARVAEKVDGDWVVNEWLKKAVLLSFRINDNEFIKGGFTNYYDKVNSKFADMNTREFRDSGVRVVPPATARFGSYIAPITWKWVVYYPVRLYCVRNDLLAEVCTIWSLVQ